MRMIFIFSITVMMMSCSDISHVPLWCCNNYQWVLNVWNIFPFVSFNSDTSRPSTSTDESGMSPDEDDDQAIGTFWKLSREYGEMGGGGSLLCTAIPDACKLLLESHLNKDLMVHWKAPLLNRSQASTSWRINAHLVTACLPYPCIIHV